MAICKILHINDVTGRKSHLSTVIEYIQSGEKTEEKILTGGYNLQPEYAMKQMMETKESFGKTGGRQAYHVIISFKEGEKQDPSEEMADILWVLICLANQTGVDLTEALQKSFEKKTLRDKERHINNPKLKQ